MNEEKTEETNRIVALVGNPNSGKTTLFNVLTHSHQYVGNWPGVTVERKEGILRHMGVACRMVDLPGIYSLSPFSPEEMVTRRELLERPPDLLINIVDTTNLERSLYLTTQLMELGRPMLLVLNMMDAVKSRGKLLDIQGLQSDLGVPVVSVSASKGEGIEELLKKISVVLNDAEIRPPIHHYSEGIETAISSMERELVKACQRTDIPVRFAAVKLFGGDKPMEKMLSLSEAERQAVERAAQKGMSSPDERAVRIADGRYHLICEMVKKRMYGSGGDRTQRYTEAIDRILTHRLFAIPLYVLIMLTILLVTFGSAGAALTDGFKEYVMFPFSKWTAQTLFNLGASEWIRSLIVDGILSGVGGVLAFLPQIALLFFFLSLLEDSGYMARATFIMDRALRPLGLSGKAFVPLMMGFGCSAPAILATRTLESASERRLTILLTPFFSCSAKMPVYALFIMVFFRERGALVIVSLYLLGLVFGVLTALFFKSTIIKGAASAYVMELPPYRIPTARNITLQIWSRLKDFIIKVTTLMLLCSIVIWIFQNFTPALVKINPAYEIEQSILAQAGQWISPLFAPLGFGFWEASVSALSGFVAKETVVSTLQILYKGESFYTQIQNAFSPISAYSYMVFILLYTPCVSAISTAYRELKSFSWTTFMVAYQCLLAWLAACLVYQVGKIFV